MLTRKQIIREVEDGRIVVDPWVVSNLQPNSLDVRLSPNLLSIEDDNLDFLLPYQTKWWVIPEEGLVLIPDHLYLGVTIERTYTPFHVPTYEGRSTTGRYFLQSHQTAGFGDVGFNGHWTLEILVKRPTRVYAGMRIGQIGFSRVYGEVEQYNGNYTTSHSIFPLPGKAGNI